MAHEQFPTDFFPMSKDEQQWMAWRETWFDGEQQVSLHLANQQYFNPDYSQHDWERPGYDAAWQVPNGVSGEL